MTAASWILQPRPADVFWGTELARREKWVTLNDFPGLTLEACTLGMKSTT